MHTQIIKLDKNNIDLEEIRKSSDLIKSGEIVAFPTETVYGLGANALDPDAVTKIFQAKGRPADNPLILHISNLSQLYPLVAEVSDNAKTLIEKFFPGPLTLVFKKSDIVPEIVTGGMDTVAIRMPSNPIAKSLIDFANVPIAAPSANISGKPSPTTANHVLQDMNGKIPLILDGGSSDFGLESTVVDTTTNPVTLLRPGKITYEKLVSVLGEVSRHQVVNGKSKVKKIVARSPGMKYTHYSPNAKVILVEGDDENVIVKISELIEKYKNDSLRVGVMTINSYIEFSANDVQFIGSDPEHFGKNLFRVLREFDEKEIDVILTQGLEDIGLGLAVMNRLRKAASEIIIV